MPVAREHAFVENGGDDAEVLTPEIGGGRGEWEEVVLGEDFGVADVLEVHAFYARGEVWVLRGGGAGRSRVAGGDVGCGGGRRGIGGGGCIGAGGGTFSEGIARPDGDGEVGVGGCGGVHGWLGGW